ncbi:MAG: DUF192 domain-containing protein [Treponema sp.]|nr:DUF192 domain-containing protein [Treponema sp.]
MNSRRLAVVLFIILSFTSCNSQKLPVREISIEREGQTIASVKAEVARTQAQRSEGLMFREKLSDGYGMIFIFETDQILSFWMKNTLIPLSIAFIAADGRIIDIKSMYPKDENTVNSSRSCRYALEVPLGWFSRTGVKEGDIVKIENLL